MELNVQLDESRSQVRLPTFVWKTVSQICSLRNNHMVNTAGTLRLVADMLGFATERQ